MKKMNKKTILMLAVTVLLLTVVVSSTIAFLTTTSRSITNTFVPVKVQSQVVESMSNNVKNDVKIKNTTTEAVDVYIRAAVVVTWQDSQGNILAQKPVEGTDYQITWTMSGWTQGPGGYYYHNSKVAQNAVTGVLFTNCKPIKAAPVAGYTLHVEVIGSAIQAEPVTAVTKAWGWSPSNQ